MRVVVTRAVHQAEELAVALRARGFEVILLPVIGIAPPADPRPLQEAAGRVNTYDWLLFTSANAVVSFAHRIRQPIAPRIAAIGPATRDYAARHGFHVALVPPAYIAESLVDALGAENLAGKRILIPSAAVTRDIVPAALRELGAHVDVIEAYRNVVPDGANEYAARVFTEPLPDWVTFASSSAVDNLVGMVGASVLGQVKIATIGPITSETVRKHGLSVAAEARVHTAEGLTDALGA